MAVMRAEVRAAIVEDLRAGKSHNSIAKNRGVSQPTVSAIAKAQSIPPINKAPITAIEARKVYDLAARLELSDKFFALVERHVEGAGLLILKDLALTFAILTDKRRLEEGKATDRHEFIDDDREFISGRVSELDARRRAKELAGQLHTEAS